MPNGTGGEWFHVVGASSPNAPSDTMIASEGAAKNIERIQAWVDKTKARKRILTNSAIVISHKGEQVWTVNIVLEGVFALQTTE